MLKTFSALCAVVAVFTALGVPVAQATPASEAFIQQNLDKANVILTATSLSDAERHEQLHALLLGLAASRRIALFTLGPYANGAAPADLDGFVGAFTNYSVAAYEKGLNRYHGQALKVTGSSVVSNCMTMSTPSASSWRVWFWSSPIMTASVGKEPGPSPSMKRPRVR